MVAVDDALDFLRLVMRGDIVPTVAQLDAAKAVARLTVAAPGSTGKKDQKREAAKTASTGKFAPAAPPLRLASSR